MSASSSMSCSAASSTQLGYRGLSTKGSRLLVHLQLARHHAHQAGAVAAASVCAQSTSAAVAATGTDQLFSQDPALDSLIDRWLSHKHASTSGAGQPGSNGSNGSSSGRRARGRQQQSLQQEWEALLGPVTVTMTSLATLEEGDGVFALSDSLGHLGSSLQELQQLASQLLQQQPQQQQQQVQQQADVAAAAAPLTDVSEYTQQLSQLLVTAAQQAAALDDAGLLNLLGISTVLLTTIRHSSASSISSMQADVQAAATAAAQAACAELWQRPGVAAGLDAVQLTSLTVILRRLRKLSISSSALPVSLPLSAYKQLKELSASEQLSGSQLAVCCWCLSSLAIPPPADALVGALRAAGAAADTTASSSSRSAGGGGLDELALRRLLAACVNWRAYLTGLLGLTGKVPGGSVVTVAAEWVQSAAQAFLQLSSTSGSSSSREGLSKVAASVAQAGAAYAAYPGDGFMQAVLVKLLPTQPAAAAAAAANSPGGSSRELQDAAAAAGCLLPWWSRSCSTEQQKQLMVIITQLSEQQQQQEEVLQSFLAGVKHSCSTVAGSLSSDVLQQVHWQLDVIAEHILATTITSSSSSSSSSSSTCLSSLLEAMVAGRCRSQHLLQLCTVAAQQGNTAAASAAAALCTLQPSGWQQQLQQLLPQLADSEGAVLQQLPLGAAVTLHAAAAAAAAECPAAAELTAAILQQLLQPGILRQAPVQAAADLLVTLTVGQGPLTVAAGQQLQAAAPAGLAQIASSSSSSGDVASAAILLQQQCLRCLSVIVRDGGRSLLPGQVVPVLAALRYLQQSQQQQQQQEQWVGVMTGQVLQAYKELHREALAAVTLQLQDSAGLLAPTDISWSVRLLALLQARPSLALGAAVTAASKLRRHMQQRDLVWTLWGLTKLRFTGEQRMQWQLLSVALDAAVAAAGGAEAEVQDEQDWADAAATMDDSTVSGSAGSSDSQLGSAVALLWVAASRGCKESLVVQLLAHVCQHGDALRPAQVASVVWSFTRLLQQGLPYQQQLQQQRQQVLQLVESGLSSTTAEQELLPQHIAVLSWGLHRLGHQPSSSVSAALVAAALQHTQQPNSSSSSSSSSTAFLPGEFSCFLYCLADWGVQLQQQQLQQLEVYLRQQLQREQQAAEAAAAGTTVDNSRNSSSSGSSGAVRTQWDGPAVCSACWALGQLGATLQHDTLQAAEQHLLRLTPASTAAAAPAGTNGANSSTFQQRRKRQQISPPAASDFVLFGTACRDAGYQPLQLLQQFRGWVLMQLAQKGPNGLLALQSRAPTWRQSAASLAATTAADAAAGTVAGQPQQRRGGRRRQHAYILSSVLLFLRQTGYADPALLQQLEVAATEQPVTEQLQWREYSTRQLVMTLYSFCKLGYVPELWLSQGGVRSIMRHVLGSAHPASSSASGGTPSASAGAKGSSSSGGSSSGSSLSAQDCVELIECLAAWHEHPVLANNTMVLQYILPGLAQTLLGNQHKVKLSAQTAGTAAGALGTGKLSSAEPAPSSTNSSKTGSAAVEGTGSTSSNTATTNLVASMPGLQVVSLLRNMVQLGLPQSGKLFQKLQQQLLRRVQQVWPEFGPAGHIAAAHAAGRSGYDLSGLLKVQELLPAPQAEVDAWHFSQPSAASRLLWVFGNVARHPGPALLTAALSCVADAASAAAEVGMLLPLHEVSTALYAVTVLQEQQHPAAVALVRLLQQAAEEGELLTHPQFGQQAEQLAACLLAAQDAAQAGGTPAPAPIASFVSLDGEQGSAAIAAATAAPAGAPAPAPTPLQTAKPAAAQASRVAAAAARNSPWLALPAAVQQRLLEAWRRKVLRKAGKKQGMGEHMQLVMSLRQLGLRGRAKALTFDGAVCIDVAIMTPSGERIAVELLGPHNAAINTQRPLAPARLKWRMLSSRGYKVVVVNMWQWRTLDSGGLGRASRDSRDGGSRDAGSGSSGGSSSSSSVSGAESSIEEYDGTVMSEKLLYLQARLQAALGPSGAAVLSAATRMTRPLPQQVGLGEEGKGLVQQPAQAAAGKRLFANQGGVQPDG